MTVPAHCKMHTPLAQSVLKEWIRLSPSSLCIFTVMYWMVEKPIIKGRNTMKDHWIRICVGSPYFSAAHNQIEPVVRQQRGECTVRHMMMKVILRLSLESNPTSMEWAVWINHVVPQAVLSFVWLQSGSKSLPHTYLQWACSRTSVDLVSLRPRR